MRNYSAQTPSPAFRLCPLLAPITSDISIGENKLSDFEKVTEEHLAPEVKINWHDAVSDGLLWLNERAWPLGGGIFFISVLYLHNYIQTEQIPLSITSTAVITALPAIFAILIFVIAVLSAVMLLPTAMLFTPMTKGEAPQIACLNLDSRVAAADLTQRRWLVLQWLAGLVIVALFWALVVFVEPIRDAPVFVQAIGILPTVLLFIGAVNFVQLRKIGIRGVSGDYIFSCFLSSLIQVIVILYVFSITTILAGATEDRIRVLLLYMLGGLGFLWFFQIAGAHLLQKTLRHQDPIAYVTLIAAVMMGTLGLFTPVGSKLAGYAFQLSASGGKPCAIVTWASDYNPDLAELSSSEPRQSMPLRILAKADDYYLVRPHTTTSKSVIFVPQDAVVAIGECPPRT